MAENSDDTKEDIKNNATGLFQGFRRLVREIFSVHDEVDKVGAAEAIKKDIVFRGFNIWILILSILICSIGLNLNSTAIIIGAMLISPLMGPITGIGYAIGTFDRDLLFLAIKNFFIAAIISVLASFLFFYFAPIGFNHSELDGRISPGVLDLFVAIFGGFAGILAATRGSKTNVIPGVAIATALMPPLCTAGFGLANGDMTYFLGATYLFFINSVFISLSALLVVRYLRFPIASYINPKVKRRAKTLIVLFVIIIAVPSVILYSKALRESIFDTEARNFINNHVNDANHTSINSQLTYTDSASLIKLFVYGKEYSDEQKDSITNLMSNYRLTNATLEIHNMGTFDAFKSIAQQKDEIIGQSKTLMNQLSIELLSKNIENQDLSNRITHLNRSFNELNQLSKEAVLVFEGIDSIDYAIKPLDDSLHRVSLLVMVDWNNRMVSKQKLENKERLNKWIKLRFAEQDSIRVIEIE
ncbi:MAG: putative hydrophobic protein (TIGR00271 family) [Bacteroidia bacterium]|jgi:uncharacterized hydrophobic protein (TIGR00271 family)